MGCLRLGCSLILLFAVLVLILLGVGRLLS
jgi:hypothetical protein